MKEQKKRTAISKAFDLLSKRQYSKKRIIEKLREKEFPEEGIEAALKKLEDLKFIDDAKFAENLIREYKEYKYFGKNRIYIELIKKGIPSELAKEKLEALQDDDQIISNCFAKFLKTHQNIDKEKFYPRAVRFLASRGFAFDEINRTIKEYLNS